MVRERPSTNCENHKVRKKAKITRIIKFHKGADENQRRTATDKCK